MKWMDSLEPRRLFAAGALDTTFGGGDGTVDVRVNVHDWTPAAADQAVDDVGRTVLAAFCRSHRQVSLTRLNVDGTVDATFGKNGIAAIDSGFNAKANGSFQIAVDHDGRVLVMLKNRLTRLNASGGFDRTFGKRGVVAAVPVVSALADVTVDANDRPLVVGTSQGKTGTRATIVRLTSAGALDASFGSGGAYKTPVPGGGRKVVKADGSDPTVPPTFTTIYTGDAAGDSIRVLPDGRIVGFALTRVQKTDYLRLPGPPNEYVGTAGVSAFRLDANGALDASYGTAGTTSVTSTYGDEHDRSSSLEAVGDDGRFVVSNGGYYDADLTQPFDDWTLVDADGHVTNANVDLVPATPPTADAASTAVAAIQPDGRLLLASYYGPVYRLTTSLAFDGTFALATVPTPASRSLLLSGERALAFSTARDVGAIRPSVVRVTAIALA